MDVTEEIRVEAARIPDRLENILTEEATKTALIMPFITALGYDIHDPTEVVPEFTADFGTKKSSRVDYAIMANGKPIMLFECKSATTNLDEEHASQLFGYFAATEARIGILTNGLVYRFHSDLDTAHRMDHTPFLEFNMLDIDDELLEELKRFAKSSFDVDSTRTAAGNLKYNREIRRILSQQLNEPSVDFVKFFMSRISPGKRMGQNAKSKFTQITQDALNQFINDQANYRLKSAMVTERPAHTDSHTEPVGTTDAGNQTSGEKDTGIVTTMEELQGLYIVKAILHDVVDLNRITIWDGEKHCAVLLDGNKRRHICRLWFNKSKKYLGLFDSQVEKRVRIENIEDIYGYAERLKATVARYQKANSTNSRSNMHISEPANMSMRA